MNDYLEILKEWERTRANQVIYEHIDTLFPSYYFRRIQVGTKDDRWISPLKIDLSQPKRPNKEKTIVGAADFKFREQGDWDSPVGVIDKLIEEYSLGSVYDAYKFIAERFYIDMPTFSGKGSYNYSKRSKKVKLLEALEDYFVWNLVNNSGAAAKKTREYLAERGFNKQAVNTFGFGFVPSWDKVESYITSARMKYSIEELTEACNVRSSEGYTSVGTKHILSIPYRCGGEIKGFLFRAIEPDVTPKYKANTSLDRKSTFFNIKQDSSPKEIIIVEGELDALMATDAGIENVVAIGGSEISGDRKSQIFDALSRKTRRITLCLDLDQGKDGKADLEKQFRAIKKSIHSIIDVSADFDQIYIASFNEPGDPDEYIRRNGPAAFKNLIEEAKPWWEYLNDFLGAKRNI